MGSISIETIMYGIDQRLQGIKTFDNEILSRIITFCWSKMPQNPKCEGETMKWEGPKREVNSAKTFWKKCNPRLFPMFLLLFLDCSVALAQDALTNWGSEHPYPSYPILYRSLIFQGSLNANGNPKTLNRLRYQKPMARVIWENAENMSFFDRSYKNDVNTLTYLADKQVIT